MKHYLFSTLSLVIFSLAPIANAEEFRIEFAWAPDMKKCFSRQSPEIRLFNVPEGTTKLTVKMKDHQSSYNHGGGKVAYNGEDVIPTGALKSWEGPCPPSPHTYSFTVKAKGGKKAKATYSQKYPQ